NRNCRRNDRSRSDELAMDFCSDEKRNRLSRRRSGPDWHFANAHRSTDAGAALELNFAPLRAPRSRMGSGRTRDSLDARATNGLLEIDAGSETIAREVFAGLNAFRRAGDRRRKYS